MKINEITIHNFRSVKEQAFKLQDYSLLIGANNSGKTNIIDALRIFYDDLKFKDDKDFPKFPTDDQESWIDIEFRLTDDEFANLKEEYKRDNNTFKVRKYLKSQLDKAKSNQSNIYAYENGKLSDNLFYGAKNISDAKLGKVIYIPDVARTDEYTKLGGPSALRDLLISVVSEVAKDGQSFEYLNDSFRKFNEEFRREKSKGGRSLGDLIDEINNEIKDWNVSFDIKTNPIKPDEIIKNLLSFYLKDQYLKDNELDISSFGQGLQRHFIYTLVKLSAKYKGNKTKTSEKNRKEFLPDLTLILFEEPEAFLHPSQQEILNFNLRKLSEIQNQQVLISTHSSHFVSKNINDLPSIIKLSKKGPETITYQLSNRDLEELLQIDKEVKKIVNRDQEDSDVEEIIYSLYLDPDRCSSFFADKVLICEGMSEKILIDRLIENGELVFKVSKVYVLNAAGKYNFCNYMFLFGKLGIKHAILFDEDNSKQTNDLILMEKNDFTLDSHLFTKKFENFLNIEEIKNRKDRYKKPLNIIRHYKNGDIKKEKIDELIKIVKKILHEEA